MKKRLIFGVLTFLTASLLISQGLVEVSKQEQERREKLKGKSVKVVTNADLKATAKTPAVAVGAPETAKGQPQSQAEAEPGAPAEAEARPGQATEEPEYSVTYAVSVYPDWFMVEKPELALGPPDGRFAEISETGVLDLDIEVNNGPGDDLAIYTRPPAKVIPEGERDNQLASGQTSMWWGDFSYGVLGLDSRGEWQEIGSGKGNSPDKFDLGALESARRIRIMFKTHANPYNSGAKPLTLAGQEITFGVDSVGALH